MKKKFRKSYHESPVCILFVAIRGAAELCVLPLPACRGQSNLRAQPNQQDGFLLHRSTSAIGNSSIAAIAQMTR
jgi:hypothetical protein